jgi:hypothetical protein
VAPPDRGAAVMGEMLLVCMAERLDRAHPQTVHRPALQRDERDEALAGRRHVDGQITVVNGESAE